MGIREIKPLLRLDYKDREKTLPYTVYNSILNNIKKTKLGF